MGKELNYLILAKAVMDLANTMDAHVEITLWGTGPNKHMAYADAWPGDTIESVLARIDTHITAPKTLPK